MKYLYRNTGKGSSVLETISTLEEIFNIKLNYKILDRREGDAIDTTKANTVLGWKAKLCLKEAFMSAWYWENKYINFTKKNMDHKILFHAEIILLIFSMYFISACKNEVNNKPKIKEPEGMVRVNGKTFLQGAKADDKYSMHREMQGHQVTVDGFFIDITEVTNKQFKAFVDHRLYYCSRTTNKLGRN